MPGRATLTNSVLNVAPLHYMQAFILPRWIILTIVKITRRFLWRGNNETYSGEDCLVAWPQVTLPKKCGGLAIINLELHNKSLIIKWLWLAHTDTQCLWTCTLTSLAISIPKSPQTIQTQHSFFIKDLAKLQPIFTAST
jgi:hypothetical protein